MDQIDFRIELLANNGNPIVVIKMKSQDRQIHLEMPRQDAIELAESLTRVANTNPDKALKQ